MTLNDQFAEATKMAQKLSTKPKDQDLLELYAYFKQATSGDATGARPGMLNLVGRRKFDAWASKKGQSSEKAMQSYVDLVQRLKG